MDEDETRPVDEPPTAADLDRIESMIDSQPPDNVVRVRDIAPLVKRLVAEVRRLSGESRRLQERLRKLQN
ncbi:MAG: hypothetical protein DMF80_08475 [Acidobacteria bacterium]|nr:MAG: hypothetical protein DMF80_08475 [Acidobacteriota bacterium]PYQ25606.1 MAG: hypothetical protein DMF81_01750 [Acidobacteriota bacterium]